MRLLIFGSNYAPEVTGSGRYTSQMATWLADRGHDVTVITAPPHYPAWRIDEAYARQGFKTENLEGVRVHRTPLYVPRANRASTLRRILMETSFTANSSAWWLRKLFRRPGPDVVICICPPMQIVLWPWIMRLARRAPVVLHVQDLQFDAAMNLGMLGSRRIARLLSSVERAALSMATHISTISDSMRTRIASKGFSLSDISLVPNWTSTTPDTDLERVKRFRDKHDIGPNQILALYSGNLGRKQGLSTLLDTANLLRENRSIRFLIIGQGVDEVRLKARAKELELKNVRFGDLVPEEELSTLLTAADIHMIIQQEAATDLVMPSKLTNILAVGRPSVATAHRDSEIGKVLLERNAGTIVPPGDPVALAAAVATISQNAAARVEMGKNARAYAEANLNINVILAGLEVTLSQFAARRAR